MARNDKGKGATAAPRKKSDKKLADGDPWGTRLDEGARAEVLDQTPQRFWQRMLKPYMWVATTCFVPAVLVAGLTVANMGNRINDMQDQMAHQQVVSTSPGRAAASQTIEQWVNQKPSPLPGGHIVSWDGATALSPTKRVDSNNQNVTSKDAWKAEVDNFSVADGAGNLWHVGVEVKLDPRGGVSVVGGPSITATTPTSTDGWDAGSTWPGIKSDTSVISDADRTAVSQWATNYASGDPSKLTVSVQDPNPGHMYVPLSNVQAVNATITDAAPLKLNDPSVAIAQVTLNILWNGEKADNTQTATVPTVMDVLIDHANTAAPVVVAWGPSGTGPTLTKYGNAVTTVSLDSSGASPSANPSTLPSSNPSQNTQQTQPSGAHS